MPTELPHQCEKQGARPRYFELSDEQRELLILFSFAFSPLIVLFVLFFLLTPDQMAKSLNCGDWFCVIQ